MHVMFCYLPPCWRAFIPICWRSLEIPFSSNAATGKTLEWITLPELFHILTINSCTFSPSFFCQLLWCIQGPRALLNGCWREWREFEPNAAVWNLLIRGMPPNTSKPQIPPLGINSVFDSLCCVFDSGLFSPQGKLPDASEPRVVSPRPGVPGWVSRPPIPGTRPNAAKDGPADSGEASLSLHGHATRRQGQVSAPLPLSCEMTEKRNECMFLWLCEWDGKWRRRDVNRNKTRDKFQKPGRNISSAAPSFANNNMWKMETRLERLHLSLHSSSLTPPFLSLLPAPFFSTI